MKYKETEKALGGENNTLRPWKEEKRNSNVKSNYKDGIFRRLFRSEEEIIELYNALSGSNYPMDAKVEIEDIQ